MSAATEEVNDKHMQPWSDLCKSAGISSTPLTPYLDQELLYNNNLSVNGTKIEQTGFSYDRPRITKELLLEVINNFISIRLFPSNIIQ